MLLFACFTFAFGVSLAFTLNSWEVGTLGIIRRYDNEQ